MSQVDLKYIFEWVVKSLGSENILSNHSTVMHHYVVLVKYAVVEFTISQLVLWVKSMATIDAKDLFYIPRRFRFLDVVKNIGNRKYFSELSEPFRNDIEDILQKNFQEELVQSGDCFENCFLKAFSQLF